MRYWEWFVKLVILPGLEGATCKYAYQLDYRFAWEVCLCYAENKDADLRFFDWQTIA